MSFINAESRELDNSITSAPGWMSPRSGKRANGKILFFPASPTRLTMTTPYSTLSALSPLDGRYASKTDKLRPILSESGFMHHRVKVEIAWLQALSLAGFAEIKPFPAAA